MNDSDNCNKHQRSDGAGPGILRRGSHLLAQLIHRISLFGENLGCRESDLPKAPPQSPRTSPQSPFAELLCLHCGEPHDGAFASHTYFQRRRPSRPSPGWELNGELQDGRWVSGPTCLCWVPGTPGSAKPPPTFHGRLSTDGTMQPGTVWGWLKLTPPDYHPLWAHPTDSRGHR